MIASSVSSRIWALPFLSNAVIASTLPEPTMACDTSSPTLMRFENAVLCRQRAGANNLFQILVRQHGREFKHRRGYAGLRIEGERKHNVVRRFR